MDTSILHLDPSQLIEAAVAAGCLVASAGFGLLLVRKARATRRRQIDALAPDPEAAPAPAPQVGARPQPQAKHPVAAAPSAAPATGLGSAGRAEPVEVASAPATVPAPTPSLARAPAHAPTPAAPATPVRSPTPAPGRPTHLRSVPDVAPAPARPARAEPPPPEPAPPPVVEAPRPPRRDTAALGLGLAKTRAGWISRLGQVFAGKREVDPAILDEVEKILLTADIGVRTSQKLIEEMRTSLSKKELNSVDAIWEFLRARTRQLLEGSSAPVTFGAPGAGPPFVLLIIGVNGSGKTTTIGKLAAKLVGEGKKVLVGAGDTFRAAAAEQLEIWAKRVGATIVRGKEGADPSSVLFDAVKKGKSEGFDVVIADTAGRLHTKVDLMEELQKVRRVIGKATEGAPHETWLVIDSTSGQNAIAQAQIFTQAMAVSGIVLTKLDGTAKGGVILGIADQLQIPVRFVGIGERADDLRAFDPDEFVEALYEDAASGSDLRR
jgi:fused signal recognition particle receptor